MATITWNSGSGDFNTGSLWSTGTVPGSGDDAVIGPGAGAASIMVDGSDAVAGLALNDAGATLTVSGGLALNTGALDVQAGSLVVTGTLSGGTLIPDGGVITVYGPSAEFDDVAVSGTLDLSGTGATLAAIELAQPSLTLLRVGANSEIDFLDEEEFEGQTIDLAGGVLSTDDADPNTGELFFGPGTTVLQDTPGTTARIGPDAESSLFGLGGVTNEGAIIVSAGTLILDSEGGAFDSPFHIGPFTNAGTLEIGAGAALVDDTVGNLAELGTIINAGGLLDLRGTLTNTNTTIDVAATGTFRDLELDDTVTGGTIIENGGTLALGSASLQGVTVIGTGVAFGALTIGANTQFNPAGGQFLLTALQSGYGQIFLDNGAVLANAAIAYGGTQYQVNFSVIGGATPAATLAASTTLNVGPGQILGLDASTAGTLVDDATINVAAGGRLNFGSAATYVAGGTINVVPGAVVALNGNIGLADLGTIVGSGATLENFGTLDLHGGTISTAGDANFSSFLNGGDVIDGTLITVAGENPNLGAISGGTLVTGAGVLSVNSVTLANTTLQGAVQLTSNGVITVSGNLNLENAEGTGPGTIILNRQPEIFVEGAATSIQFLQSLTLSNAVVLLSGVTPATEAGAFNAQSDLEVQGYQTLTLAPNTEIADTTENGPIGILGGPGFFLNEGRIAITPGADLVVGPYGSKTQQNFVNQGLITIAAGGTLDIATQASILSLGQIVGPGGLVRFTAPDSGANDYDNTGNTIIVGGPSGAPDLELDDTTLTGGTIVNAGGQFTGIDGATLNNVTYVGSLHVGSGVDFSGLTDPGDLIFTGGTLESQSVTIDPSANLVLGADQSFTGAAITLSGDLTDPDHSLSFDAATVLTVVGNPYLSAGHILNSGTILIGPGDALNVDDTGAMTAPETSTPGTIIVDGGQFTTNVLDSGQTVDLSAGGMLNVSSRFDAGSDIVFQGPSTLDISQGTTFDASISGFGAGDAIDLTNYQDGSIAQEVFGNNGIPHGADPTITLGYNDGTLTVTRGGTLAIAMLPVGPGYDLSGFSVVQVGSPPYLVTGYDLTYAAPDQPAPVGPAISGTVANQQTDDQTPVTPFAGVDLTDPNVGAIVTAIVTRSYYGATLSAPGGGTISDFGAVWSDTGSVGSVQAALRAMVFTPMPYQTPPTQSITDGLSLAVSDQVASATDTTTSVVVTAVEDPILVSGVTALEYTTGTTGGGGQPFNHIVIDDPDDATFTATATLSGTGSAVFGHSYGATIASNGVFSTSGSLGYVTTVLQNLVAYTSAPVPDGQTTTTTVTMTISDGFTQSVTDSGVIVDTATGAADAAGLQILGTASGQAVTDATTVAPFAAVAIVDPEVGALDTVTITPSNPANGALSDSLGGTVSGDVFTLSGTVTSDGLVDNIDSILPGLIFTPTPGQVAAGQTVTTDFTVTASNDAGVTTDMATSVIATAVGHQLTISGTQANQEITDSSRALPFAGVTLMDTLAGADESATVTLSNAASGMLIAGGSGTVGTNGVFQVSGSLSQVQAALEAVAFAPAAAAAGQLVTTGVTISVSDGTLTTTDTTTSLDVVGTGVAGNALPTGSPSITGAVSGQDTTDEAAINPFAGVAITDPNIGQTETLTITQAVLANGALSNFGIGSYDGATGVYTVTGSTEQVTAAAEGLSFTPTEHQVAPSDMVTTDFTIAVVDTDSETASDSTTSVIATAVNDPPSITHATVALAVPNESSDNPFASLVVNDLDVGHIDTVSAALSSPVAGTLSNPGGGNYNPITGVYTVSGTASSVTNLLDALVFTPSAPAQGVYVTTTDFTVGAAGPGGSDSDGAISVSAVQQVLELATVPTGDIAFSVSPDGSTLAAAIGGKSNEAVVTAPASGTQYDLPAGYQAEYLGGSTDAELVDKGGGDAVLVGNTGNDTIGAGNVSNDSIIGGNGNNTIYGGSGQIAVIAGSGDDQVVLPDDANYGVSLGGGNDTVYASGGGTISGGTGQNRFEIEPTAGINVIESRGTDLLVSSGMLTTASISGSGSTLLGVTGVVDAVVSGPAATVAATGATTNVTTSGSAGLYYGDSSPLVMTDTGEANTVVGGLGAVTVTTATNALLYGGGGPVLLDGGAGTPTMVGGSVGASIVAGSGGVAVGGGDGTPTVSGAATLYGAAGGTIDYVGPVGGALFVAEGGAETLNAAGASTSNLLFGSADSSSTDQIITGTGQDTISTLAAAVTVNATASPFVWGGSGSLLVNGGAGTPTVVGGSGGASVIGGSGGVVVAGNAGTPTVSGSATLFGSAGNTIDYVGGTGGAFFVAESGAETIDASGASTNNQMFGSTIPGSSQMVLGGSGTDTVVANASAVTVQASASGHEVVGAGSGPLTFIGGAGGSTIFGGSGTASISGGAGGVVFAESTGGATLDGAATVGGSAGGVIDYVGSAGGLTYFAAAGAETVNASASTTDNVMWASAASNSSDVMQAGSGNDNLIAGPGANTLVGGSGSDTFVFIDGRGGGTAMIADFLSQDTVDLLNYGSSAAATALAGAVSSGGNTTITLNDNTQITFLGVAGVSSLTGHVFST